MFRIPQRKESSVENAVVTWAKRHGIRFCPKIQGTGNKGMPDRAFLLPGHTIFLIEFKRLTGKARELQEYMIKELRKDGHDVEIHHTTTSAIEALQRRLDAAKLSS